MLTAGFFDVTNTRNGILKARGYESQQGMEALFNSRHDSRMRATDLIRGPSTRFLWGKTHDFINVFLFLTRTTDPAY
jgi:hypothetical protein